MEIYYLFQTIRTNKQGFEKWLTLIAFYSKEKRILPTSL